MAAFTLEAQRQRNAGSYVAGPFTVPATVRGALVTLTTSSTGGTGRFDGVAEWSNDAQTVWSPRHWFGADVDPTPTEQTVNLEKPAGMTRIRVSYSCTTRVNIAISGETYE